MNTTIPIPPDRFKVIPFSLISNLLSNYFWLKDDFTRCYRFISFPGPITGMKTGSMEIINAFNPKAVSLDEQYTAEYDLNHEKLHIHFLGDRFFVKKLKANFENVTAMILHLIDSEGRSRFLFSATTDPFNPELRKIYSAMITVLKQKNNDET